MDLIFVSVFSLSFLGALLPILFDSSWFKLWSSFYMGLNGLYLVVLYCSVGVIIKDILRLSSDYSEEQESTSLNVRFLYPPIRYSIILTGLLCSLFFPFFFKGLLYLIKDCFLYFLSFFVGLGWSGIKFHIMKLPIWKHTIVTSLEHSGDTISWLKVEGSIESCTQDRFERGEVVNRIVTRLNTHKKESINGQVIVGGFGSGKSSVLKLVEERLLVCDDWIVCHFDSWGRIVNGEQGQRLILEKVIEEISAYVGTSSIKSIPKNYLNSLNGLGVWWKNITAILNNSDLNPDSQLEKLQIILETINKKIVVFIEDIDRNNDSERLAKSISPLLDRLVNTPNIQFIFTIGYEEHMTPVINRVTNYREDLLTNKKLVSKMLSDFRKECIFSSNDLWYFDGTKSIENWPLRDGGSTKGFNEINNTRTKKTYDAILSYINNPREAKYCLRHIYEAWNTGLCGEVNFDQLLILNVLKYNEPLAFDFLLVNSELFTTPNGKSLTEQRWSNISSNLNSAYNAEVLIEYIFGKGTLNGFGEDNIFNCLQLISAKESKYLSSIVNGHIDTRLISEQKVFSLLFGICESFNDEHATISEVYDKCGSTLNILRSDLDFKVCLKFKNEIDKEKRGMVFTILTRCFLDRFDSISYQLQGVCRDLIDSSFELIGEKKVERAEKVFAFLLSSSLKNNFNFSRYLYEYLRGEFTHDEINFIKGEASKIFFDIYKDFSCLVVNKVSPDELAWFIMNYSYDNKEDFEFYFNLLIDVSSSAPNNNVRYLERILANQGQHNEFYKYICLNNVQPKVRSLINLASDLSDLTDEDRSMIENLQNKVGEVCKTLAPENDVQRS
ncbi:P-loop NTPase fold protein [Vibrio campbellii]